MQALMTEGVAEAIPALYAQEGVEDPVVYAHLFSCLIGWDWYITEYDPESGEAFGLVRGLETEWGYVYVPEFEGVNRARGFNVIERDEHWAPVPASTLEGRR